MIIVAAVLIPDGMSRLFRLRNGSMVPGYALSEYFTEPSNPASPPPHGQYAPVPFRNGYRDAQHSLPGAELIILDVHNPPL
ncbi:MAG: hypothetical protein WCI64_08560 [Chlorobium sp.]